MIKTRTPYPVSISCFSIQYILHVLRIEVSIIGVASSLSKITIEYSSYKHLPSLDHFTTSGYTTTATTTNSSHMIQDRNMLPQLVDLIKQLFILDS